MKIKRQYYLFLYLGLVLKMKQIIPYSCFLKLESTRTEVKKDEFPINHMTSEKSRNTNSSSTYCNILD